MNQRRGICSTGTQPSVNITRFSPARQRIPWCPTDWAATVTRFASADRAAEIVDVRRFKADMDISLSRAKRLAAPAAHAAAVAREVQADLASACRISAGEAGS